MNLILTVEQNEDELRFEDYFNQYSIDLTDGKLSVNPYSTEYT